MSRYIDADKLKETLANYHPFTTKQELKFNKIIKIINEEPTVEATEKITGEWIFKEEIKEALEKQIPKKPEIIEGKMWVCPNCNNNLLWLYEEYPEKKTELNKGLLFCLSCGQALNWEVK